MRAYFDASVLVALLTEDALTTRAEAFIRDVAPIPVVSDFAAAEFASALARRVRTGEIEARHADQAFEVLDTWISRVVERAETTSSDVKVAETFLRRFDVNLRTPDALNIAIAKRVDAALVTFDEKMAAAASVIGSTVLPA
ncbi:MAG TPA: type II toxin-antitoxin system VapC family toxin [Lichenihabitans sp.]|jgi:predicted nucleic acid-binding protein|nr:type II toxin-antitoxin system VapC family toxin [Lichenihabitans sp.]